MGALITLLVIVAAVSGTLWSELRQFDRLSANAAASHERDAGQKAQPLDATYYF
jgi:hypothetical protein